MRQRLASQVHRPVYWTNTVKAMLEAGATSIVECGPGKVLAGLVRRINRGTPVKTIDSMAGLQKALQD
jgi:[acyl-carrier-protein] S-malonyltransferase